MSEIIHSAIQEAICIEKRNRNHKNPMGLLIDASIDLSEINCVDCLRKLIWWLDARLSTVKREQ